MIFYTEQEQRDKLFSKNFLSVFNLLITIDIDSQFLLIFRYFFPIIFTSNTIIYLTANNNNDKDENT